MRILIRIFAIYIADVALLGKYHSGRYGWLEVHLEKYKHNTDGNPSFKDATVKKRDRDIRYNNESLRYARMWNIYSFIYLFTRI
jgi:hypothetical protein